MHQLHIELLHGLLLVRLIINSIPAGEITDENHCSFGDERSVPVKVLDRFARQ